MVYYKSFADPSWYRDNSFKSPTRLGLLHQLIIIEAKLKIIRNV